MLKERGFENEPQSADNKHYWKGLALKAESPEYFAKNAPVSG
jgi:hypothetical protein